MTFDYYIGTKQNMLTDTESAAEDAVSQLQRCTRRPGQPGCGI